jgi:hypothetical protein
MGAIAQPPRDRFYFPVASSAIGSAAPDAINSACMQPPFWKLEAWKLWAAAGFPPACWSCRFRWPGRCPLAVSLRVVRAGSAAVGDPVAGVRMAPRPLRRAFCSPISAAFCGTWATATGCATRCRTTAICRLGADAAAARIQHGAGALLWALRPGRVLVRRATGSTRWRWPLRPSCGPAGTGRFAHYFRPWDQLGYSQVDNGLVNQLAPWTAFTGSALCWLR